MQIELTHERLATFAERVGLPLADCYDRARRGGLELVREAGEWWIHRDVWHELVAEREAALERDLRIVRKDLVQQGFTGERLERELADVGAYLRGAGRGVTR